MEKWDEKTNNEIVIRLKEMELEHQNVKDMIISFYEKMEEIEHDFKKGNEVLNARLKRNV